MEKKGQRHDQDTDGRLQGADTAGIATASSGLPAGRRRCGVLGIQQRGQKHSQEQQPQAQPEQNASSYGSSSHGSASGGLPLSLLQGLGDEDQPADAGEMVKQRRQRALYSKGVTML
ncbi:hypothetical protein H920_04188 [Fukomys damarensis]|uniref:Uncharacterized protein n=1 Tax=Fukomys damarensis TaxID=885580 RepID=A0A091DVB5_FUKDA|nr:hypothetical protein H920_04188 [Fukomys damarensis]